MHIALKQPNLPYFVISLLFIDGFLCSQAIVPDRCSAIEAVQGFSTTEIRLLLHGTDKRPVLLGLDQNISPVRKTH